MLLHNLEYIAQDYCSFFIKNSEFPIGMPVLFFTNFSCKHVIMGVIDATSDSPGKLVKQVLKEASAPFYVIVLWANRTVYLDDEEVSSVPSVSLISSLRKGILSVKYAEMEKVENAYELGEFSYMEHFEEISGCFAITEW